MPGDLQAASLRSLPRLPRGLWTEWVRAVRRDRDQARLHRVEVIERLTAEERRSRRAGEHRPTAMTMRHWS